MRALYCVAAFLVLLPAACGDARQGEQPAEEESVPEPVEVEELAAGDAGLEEPQVMISASAAELAAASGVEVPERGGGLYIAAHAGERPTGGHSVEVEATGPEGGPAELRVSVSEPGPGDIATQALTYPYAVVLVWPAPPDGSLSFVDGEGGELGWPVRRLSG
ncbi:MAG: protease complex subunit PrcB family protein [Rubrobacter sp.]|nr:protease complex subunit PrcB family protein [Rubrobacter sp.]